MATVDSWFLDWQGKHIRRFPRPDWPPAGDVFWEEFESLFIRHGVTEEVAAAASSMLFEEPPAFVGQHPELLLEKIRTVWREAKAKTTPIRPESRPEDHSAWDRAADANWQSLGEAEREIWRAMVRDRIPDLTKRPGWLEATAMGWAFDPSLVCDLPPPREVPDTGRGPRRVSSSPKPKGS